MGREKVVYSFRHLCLTCLIAFFTILIAACGGSDNNDSPTGSTSYSLQGYIQKGPLVQGSEIDIQQLDTFLMPVGDVINTETINDIGEFVVEADITGEYFDVEATGLYYNEVTGSGSDGPIILHAIIDASESNFNVNILTSLIYNRIKYLIPNNDMSFADAQEQASNEVAAVFHVNRSLFDEDARIDFYDMDLSKPNFGVSFLITVASILQWGNTEAELTDLITSISTDIETDGRLDNQVTIDEIYTSAKELKGLNADCYSCALQDIVSNLYDFYDPYVEGFFEFPPIFDGLLVTEPLSPIFNLLAGTYTEDISVSLSSDTPNVVIYYTTDGSEPTHKSAVYFEPITININGTTLEIKAIAAANGSDDSHVVTSYYKIDSGYDDSQYMDGLLIDDYKSNIVGTWIGYVDTDSHIPPYNAEITFYGSGSYSAHALTPYINYNDLTERENSVFYYAGPEGNESGTYEIKGVYANGKASAEIVTPSYYGRILDNITFYNDFNNLSFEFGSGTFTLTRKE